MFCMECGRSITLDTEETTVTSSSPYGAMPVTQSFAIAVKFKCDHIDYVRTTVVYKHVRV